MNIESGYYDFENIWLVYDSLKVITYHKDKHQFPKWVNETVWNKITEMFNLWGQYEYSTDLLKRLQGGELWKEIFARLNNLMKEHSTWEQKMYAYSAHDDTLAVLLSMFGMKLTAYPPYAALVLLETHRIDNQFILQWKNLEAATSNFIPLNWEMECDPFVLYRKMSTFGLFISMISIVAVISCQILKTHLMKRKVYGDRTVLPSDADVALLREDVIR
ncbi:hypothetical protein WUBG_04775 [Wuchereria bancrofti]|uniref:Histidine acid phosphatase n=1 Tax=Wuchereria bancrofti TaxID=6293 RepID=J9F4A6_WUCBA|nr:hypothetical protein WUBG_04775 [Wuchereria bancrofti]